MGVMLVRPAAAAMLWSFCAGDPNVTCSMHGAVKSAVGSVKEPSAAVVVDALPATHLAVTAAPLIAAPTAAVPVMGAVAAVGTGADADGLLVSPPPPPQAAKAANTTADAVNLKTFFVIGILFNWLG